MQLSGLQQRLAIEAPPKKVNGYVLHLTTDHDNESCPDVIRRMHFLTTNEPNSPLSGDDTKSYWNGDSKNLFLEYESNLEKQGECYAIINGHTYNVLTRGQKVKVVAD